MTRPRLSGIHHVKIPVTDLRRSVDWYTAVLGFELTMEFADREDGVVRGVAGTVPGLGETQLTLRVNPQAAEGCKGFDPVSFAVDDRAHVESWAAHLDGLGIGHSPVIEASIGWLLVFDDPDGLQLHLYSWAEHGVDKTGKAGYGQHVHPAASG